MRLAVEAHLHALDGGQEEIVYHNAIDEPPRWLRWVSPDLVVLHPTFLGVRWDEDFASYRHQFGWVAKVNAPKVALPQDEYDHSAVLEEWLLELGVKRVFSCFDSSQYALLYPRLAGSVEISETLTGYIDGNAAAQIADRLVPPDERPFDLVYRAAQLPYWFGSHGQLKHRLAEIVGGRARQLGFRTDISTRWGDTIFGNQWLDFVMSGRAIVGCESGSSVLDPRGLLQARIREELRAEPGLSFDEIDSRMPPGWDSYAFFAISPRHLEAVITKTAQMLVEGRYSGVLEPDRHYIPLRRDFSNLDEALERLRDVGAVTEMTDRAYDEIYRSGLYTLNAFAEEVRASSSNAAPSGLRLPVSALRAGAYPAQQLGRIRDRFREYGEVAMGRIAVTGRAVLFSISLAAAVREPTLRRLLAVGLINLTPRQARRLVGDVVRLSILVRIRDERRRTGGGWSIQRETANGIVVLTTTAGGEPANASAEAPIERVTWDHSSISESVPIFPRRSRLGSIPVGYAGHYEFAALEVLASSPHAAVVHDALHRVIG